MNERPLPPGQNVYRHWPVEHYGRIPTFKPDSWLLRITGLTASGAETLLGLDDFVLLPRTEVEADLHCGRGWTVQKLRWGGVAATTILERFPPAESTTHVVAWAEHGYTTLLRLEDLRRPKAVLADSLDGEPLSAERGYPLRLVVPHLYGYKGPKWLRGLEYVDEPRRGFWEDRGWHIVGDVWREQRYSYQE